MRARRTVPPVGYRPAAAGVLKGFLATRVARRPMRQRLLHEMSDTFGGSAAFAVSSGKAALFVILCAMRSLSPRRKVVLPAYTCFSVPSAIVRAGLVPVPCDLADGTFDYDYDKLSALLDDDTLAALSIHLFSLPADTRRLRVACGGRGVVVIEDAAQAMGVTEDNEMLGTRGDVAFFSLGRGKNISCGGGGLILANRADLGDAIAAIVPTLPEAGVAADLVSMVKLLTVGVLISPAMYWLPSAIPWLKLGETLFHADFRIARLSNYAASILSGWRATLARLSAVRRDHARFYVAHVPGVRDYGDVPYLRFPVVVTPEVKQRVLREHAGSTFGISGFYPTAVHEIPELRRRFDMPACPTAQCLARCLVTLPTHPLLSVKDRDNVCQLVSSVMQPN